MNVTNTFYVVWSPQGATPPRATFLDEAKAIEAAEEMAQRFAAQTFFVMKAVTSSRALKVMTARLGEVPQ